MQVLALTAEIFQLGLKLLHLPIELPCLLVKALHLVSQLCEVVLEAHGLLVEILKGLVVAALDTAVLRLEESLRRVFLLVLLVNSL